MNRLVCSSGNVVWFPCGGSRNNKVGEARMYDCRITARCWERQEISLGRRNYCKYRPLPVYSKAMRFMRNPCMCFPRQLRWLPRYCRTLSSLLSRAGVSERSDPFIDLELYSYNTCHYVVPGTYRCSFSVNRFAVPIHGTSKE